MVMAWKRPRQRADQGRRQGRLYLQQGILAEHSLCILKMHPISRPRSLPLNEASIRFHQANLPLHMITARPILKAFDTGVIKPERAAQIQARRECG